MESIGPDPGSGIPAPHRELKANYAQRIDQLQRTFLIDGDGPAFCQARSNALDELIRGVWDYEAAVSESAFVARQPLLALLATGGYGRAQLFPYSDIDLLFCTGRGADAEQTRELIRKMTEALWDCGLKVSPTSRSLSECERFKAADPEFSLALLDLRFVTGHRETGEALVEKILNRRSPREARALATAAAELARRRYDRFGNTLFHLEPNVKDSPGGLRDSQTRTWLTRLRTSSHDSGLAGSPESALQVQAIALLVSTRCLLHFRHHRDDNILDWHTQDEAAVLGIGTVLAGTMAKPAKGAALDAAAWMRTYFRQARLVERALQRELAASDLLPRPSRALRRVKAPPLSGFYLRGGVLELKIPQFDGSGPASFDPAHDAEIVLAAFGLIATTGVRLGLGSEGRIAASVPYLSGTLEEGPRLWSRLRTILLGRYAGGALRELHAVGVLELILPEFHGIDALVIRDAYHRYTVDEHTFVLVDVLHSLADTTATDAADWRTRFRIALQELPHPELLFLAALLHDTGKGRTTTDHAAASAQLAERVCSRLELGSYESSLVVQLIACHLEMSAALRRDIFDPEAVRAFANRVGTQQMLRMLTLFTYADISAVHPDALTPWKAENLWRLFMATANQLDRTVDDDRVDTTEARTADLVMFIVRALGYKGEDRLTVEAFLAGFPERYLRTRSPQLIQEHLQLWQQRQDRPPVRLVYTDGTGEATIVTQDRPSLFADLAATLAEWGMDVVNAEAFSNAAGLVVDTFRFVDTYQTLGMNPQERDRLRNELAQVLSQLSTAGQRSRLRRGRRSAPRRIIETVVEFDNEISSRSTLLQVVAQNVPGLLRTTAVSLTEGGYSIEVALIDTEGEMAIDVFYITRDGAKLNLRDQGMLQINLTKAITDNASQK